MLPVFTTAVRLALAGYSGLTGQAYELDLRQFASWCGQQGLPLFQARRPDIECFARDLEARGRARATITRRLCTIAGFCKYAVEEELLEHSPAAHVRRPRLDYESHATSLDHASAACAARRSHSAFSVIGLLPAPQVGVLCALAWSWCPRHAADLGVRRAGCGGCQDVASDSVALGA